MSLIQRAARQTGRALPRQARSELTRQARSEPPPRPAQHRADRQSPRFGMPRFGMPRFGTPRSRTPHSGMLRVLPLPLLTCAVALSVIGGGGPVWAAAVESVDAATIGEAAPTDLAMMLAEGPFVLRLYLERENRPHVEHWRAHLASVLEYLDTDGSGDLDEAEFDRGDWSQFALNLDSPRRRQQLRLVDVDLDPDDGRVTLDELVAALGDAAMKLTVGPSGESGVRGEPLLRMIDLDEDGRLSLDEVSALPARLRIWDFDDSETLVTSELSMALERPLPTVEPVVGGLAPVTPARRRGTQNEAPPPERVLTLPPRRGAAALARAMLRWYDRVEPGRRSGDERLDATELRIGEQAFAAADTNADGYLDYDELVEWAADRAPDLELLVRADAPRTDRQTVRIVTRDGNAPPLANQLLPGNDGSIHLRLTALRVDIQVRGPAGSRFKRESQYRQQFRSLDIDQNGYLDRNEAGFVFGGGAGADSAFDRIDVDGDGMIFPKEFYSYMQALAELSIARTDVTVQDLGSRLFDVLDADRDGQLSMRELARLSDLHSSWDRDGDGVLSIDEIPSRMQITIGPGEPPAMIGGVFLALSGNAYNVGAGRRSDDGPRWFAGMDRNRDGLISPREFPGSRALFDQLDTNGDGAIDPAEATAYDAQQAGQ